MTEGLYPHLKNCIGAIDGTHIRAVIPVDQQVRYIGRTGAVTQNVMAICDFDMHFTCASIGQPGAMHDTSVLYHAIDKDRATFPHPPKVLPCGCWLSKQIGLSCTIQRRKVPCS